MKVLLAAVDRLDDPNSWSGTPHQVYKSLLQAGHEVVTLTGLSTTRAPWHIVPRLVLGKDRYLLWMTSPSLTKMASRLRDAENDSKPDVIVAIGAQFLVKAHPSAPVILFSDAPWAAFRRSYAPFVSDFPIRSRWYEKLERRAAIRAAHLIYSSEWARAEAVQEFGVDPSTVSVVRLGANWTPESGSAAEETSFEPVSKRENQIRLLFVGRDWKRKGGDIAVGVLRALHGLGLDAHLEIVGVSAQAARLTRPEPGISIVGLTAITSEKYHAGSMRERFERADFVLVPSRAECFGIIYAEAAAFGKPSVALNVDAVGEVVTDGLSGLLFPQNASPEEIASKIADCAADQALYSRLSLGARSRYLAELNWIKFGENFSTVLESVIKNNISRRT